MTDDEAPPGGPLNPEFHDAIHRLADQAREEDRLAEEARVRAAKPPVRTFIRIGLVLIAAEALLFAYLYSHQQAGVAKVSAPAAPPKNCGEAVYQTYWKVVAYLAEKGHPPNALGELLPKYAATLPSDPTTGKALEYSTDGTRFEVHCAGQAPRGKAPPAPPT